jgi:hypothetical protein
VADLTDATGSNHKAGNSINTSTIVNTIPGTGGLKRAFCRIPDLLLENQAKVAMATSNTTMTSIKTKIEQNIII